MRRSIIAALAGLAALTIASATAAEVYLQGPRGAEKRADVTRICRDDHGRITHCPRGQPGTALRAPEAPICRVRGQIIKCQPPHTLCHDRSGRIIRCPDR
jgi:hypothetical protein